jgi:hypothetical protein
MSCCSSTIPISARQACPSLARAVAGGTLPQGQAPAERVLVREQAPVAEDAEDAARRLRHVVDLVADGKLRDVAFDVKIERSSWVALRILPSSHTNPIFMLVGGKPIRASRRSAEWCLKSVD